MRGLSIGPQPSAGTEASGAHGRHGGRPIFVPCKLTANRERQVTDEALRLALLADARRMRLTQHQSSRVGPLPVSGERRLNGNALSNSCLSLTHWGARGVGPILRAIHRKGRRRDIVLRLVCASLRDHLPAYVHLSFPSSKVCHDLACTLASARGAVAPLQTPRAAYVWASRCTLRRRLSSDGQSLLDGPRQLNIDVSGFS
jgi:hypothetical protein